MGTRFLHKVSNNEGQVTTLIGHAIALNHGLEKISRDTVLNAYKKYGFPEKYVVGIRAKSAFINALKQAKKKNILHQVEDTDLITSYQFDEKFIEEIGNERQAKFNTKSVVTYIKADDRITCNDNEMLDLVLDFLKITKENYLKLKFSEIIRNTIKSETNSTPLRRAGGVYFVPAQYTDFIFNFIEMLKEIDPSGDFIVIEIPDTAKSKASVAERMEEKHKAELKLLQKKMADISEKGESFSPTIYRNLMEEILKINKLMEMEAFLVENDLKESKEMSGKVRKMAEDFIQFGIKVPALSKEEEIDIPDIVKEDLEM